MNWLPFNSLVCWQITLTLLHVSWVGLVIGLFAAFSIRMLRNSTASRRYCLNFAALLLFAVSLPVTFAIIRSVTIEVPVALSVVETPVAELANLTPSVTETPAILTPPNDVVDFPLNAPQALPSAVAIPVAVSSPMAIQSTPSTWERVSSIGHAAAPFITILYAIGVVLMFVKLAFGVRVSRRLRSSSQPITDATILARMAAQAKKLSLRITPVIAYCEHTAVPIVVGLLRPMILIPAAMVNGLTIEQLESVLSHELAHLRRRDHLMIVVQRVLEAILFFHPVTWYLSHRLHDDRETSCDDLVLSIGGDRIQYAQSLLRVAELRLASQAHQKHITLAADGQRPSKLRLRIARLLESPEQTDVRISSLGWMLVSLIGLAIGTTSAASALSQSIFDDQEPHASSNSETGIDALPQAQEKSPQEDTKPDIRTLWNSDKPIQIVGYVRDIYGKPVSGGNVSRPVFANRRVKLNRIQTDAEGRFELNVIGKDLLFFNNIWIWHEGYSLAAPSLYQFIPGAVEHTKPEVILQPESLVRFRIERPDGKSLKNANVYPAEMVIPNATEPVDGMHGLYSFLPDDELKKFATRTTNDHGEVELPHVPADVLSAVGVATDEFGVQEFDIRSLTGPKRLTMEPVGRLIGTAPPGTRIEIQSRRGGTTIIGEGRANVVADSDGHFEVKALARGRVTITPYNSENSEWLMEDQFVILEPASMLTIDIVPQATIPATGRLVHADSKLPIANARVALQVASSTRTWLGSVVTDADGKFRSRCLPGKQFVAQLIMLPEAEMLYPKPTQLMFQVPVDAKSFELPNIEIRTAKIGKGKLVDANNNPVAGKYVQHYFDNKPIDDPSRTDDNGEFEYVIDKEIITDRWAAVLKWDLRDKSGNAGSANDRFEVEATVISDDPLVLQIDDPE